MISCRCVFAIAAVTLAISPARAQQGNIQGVRFYTIKPDRVADFLAATKEVSALQTKAGSERYYSVWHSLSGANEYVRVDFYTKWADLGQGPDPKMKDLATDLLRITTRIAQCEESTHRIIDEVLPEYSLPPAGEVPKMIRVLRTKVRPEKLNEYLALAKSEILPAIKKSGAKFYNVSQVRYGESVAELVSVTGFNSWADLDGGLGVQKGLGEEGYQRFLAKLRPLIVDSQFDIYSLVTDSSHLPPAR
ncbi:MAG TPA: hypothetical protein VNU44_06600 [Bryobacteraceae bacterium]|jgi:hypothetical protein|nr:hypothetical protein [Bryobacteraceae bacterium]